MNKSSAGYFIVKKSTIAKPETSKKAPQYIKNNFLEVGLWLLKLWEDGPEAIRDEAERLKISCRTAYYLAEVALKFGDLKVEEERLQGIGWTKLQIIGRYVTPTNSEALLQLAENNTAYNLAQIMKNQKPEAVHSVLLYLTAGQYAAFRNALLAFGATDLVTGLANKEKALTEALKASLS
jgi:hypothetical protein